jgi:protein arginine kinase
MRDNDPVTPILKLHKPWDHNSNPVWLASTINLQRNIEKFIFPGKLDLDRKKQIIALVGKEALTLEGLTNPSLLKAENLTAFEKEYLNEHFLTFDSFHHAGQGEGFLIDESGQQMILFNIDDHLSFYRIDTVDNFEGSWNQLAKLESSLGEHVAYSFSPKFGFLTSDPRKCGTAMTVTIYLQVPGLVHLEKLDEVIDANEDENIVFTGLQGDPSEIIGDILAIRNNFTLGVTEENCLATMRTYATKFMAEENNARQQIRQSNNPMIMDKVSRALAVLLHSYLIETVEALNAISILKLGLEMGWVSGTTHEALNKLFFNCRRAHLLSQYGDKLQQQEIPHKRAEYIHAALKEVKQLI